jgi:hypothetical protein
MVTSGAAAGLSLLIETIYLGQIESFIVSDVFSFKWFSSFDFHDL